MTRKVNIMTNVVKGDQVKDSYGKIYDVIEVHEHNVMVLEPGNHTGSVSAWDVLISTHISEEQMSL